MFREYFRPLAFNALAFLLLARVYYKMEERGGHNDTSNGYKTETVESVGGSGVTSMGSVPLMLNLVSKESLKA